MSTRPRRKIPMAGQIATLVHSADLEVFRAVAERNQISMSALLRKLVYQVVEIERLRQRILEKDEDPAM